MGGSHQDLTYSIHVKHTKVQHPRNITPEDLANESAMFTRPTSEPTAMAYFIQRIRFAEICRDIVDHLIEFMPNIEHINYDEIIRLDSSIDDFLVGLPLFFRTDEINQRANQKLDQDMPQFPIQRYTINAFAHCRRIRLNQPFLIRGALDLRYSHSRDACLRSARAIVSLTKSLGNGKSPFGLAHESSYFVIQQMFLATVVLVMDLCFTKVERLQKAMPEEVTAACKMLEDFKENSPVASRYVESLKDVMRKHNVNLRNPPSQAVAMAGASPDGTSTKEGDAEIRVGEQSSLDCASEPAGIWQGYFDMEAGLDDTDWSQLFHDLEYQTA
jgi:hypothetical protein